MMKKILAFVVLTLLASLAFGQATVTVTSANQPGVAASTISPSTGTGSAVLSINPAISAGTGTGTFSPQGIINVQNNAGGNGNTATTADIDLFTYTLPAASLSANGKGVRVRAGLSTAGNANNKTFKLWFAGVTIISSGVIASNGKNATIEMEIWRLSSTAITAIGTFTVDGAASVVTVTTTTAVANLDSNTSIVKVTGASPTTGAAGDAVAYNFKVSFEN